MGEAYFYLSAQVTQPSAKKPTGAHYQRRLLEPSGSRHIIRSNWLCRERAVKWRKITIPTTRTQNIAEKDIESLSFMDSNKVFGASEATLTCPGIKVSVRAELELSKFPAKGSVAVDRLVTCEKEGMVLKSG